MTKSVLIFLAHGTEETEFVATYDVLVRAGARVTSAFVESSSQSLQDPHVAECTRGVKIVPDVRLNDLSGGQALKFDAVVVPGGGPGSKTIASDQDVQALVAKYYGDGKIVAAICAGSLVIKESGIARGSEITSHPSVKEELSQGASALRCLGRSVSELNPSSHRPNPLTCRLSLLREQSRRCRQPRHIVSRSWPMRNAKASKQLTDFFDSWPSPLRFNSRGPGTAILFALTLVEKLFGKEKRDEVEEPMILSERP